MHVFVIAALVVLRLALGAVAQASETPVIPSSERLDFFEKKIRPVLAEHCYKCHSTGAEKIGGGLLLDTRPGIRQGGESGPAVVPGEVDDSLLLEAIRYESLEMPPDRKLPAEVITDFEHWIRAGATDPRDGLPVAPSKPAIDIESGRQFWSFRPPQPHQPPVVRQATWPRRPVDNFILAQLETAGLAPGPEADRRTLIRRLSFDLTGLPPSVEEVEDFVSDPSPTAYENAVERLLASPHYGERWARLWLDVSRYAEDQAHIVGKNDTLFYPNAYLYRDWVLQVFNDDLPYDQFLRLQLAGDLIDPDDDQNRAALGFIGLGPKYYRRGDLTVMADEWEDRVDVVARGLLGLTVACARCHDHKYDPIPTTDYYALAGVFASTEMFNRPFDEDRKTQKDGQAKDPADAMHIIRDAKPTDLTVFIRGDVNNAGPKVERRFLQVLCASEPPRFTTGSGRRELADCIASRQNPLTARVLVNRIWAQYMGHGLVRTLSNFGATGERPTHPELLDDLAVRFMEAGWSLKWLHRQIVLSATYRQASDVTKDQQIADPENRLLGRMNRRRLGVEAWRDTVLAVTNHLDESLGGTSIDIQDPESQRRTVYSRVSRLQLNPMLAMFDFPDPNAHADHRVETTTAVQKLFVLNSPFMVHHAELLADRLLELSSDLADDDMAENEAFADRVRIARAYQLLYGRPVTKRELRLGLAYLRQGEDNRKARWRQYAQVLLAANEMMFLD